MTRSAAHLLYWMALQLELDIVERHRHETDLLPDDERTVPFGMGATVFYNHRDLRFRNSLSQHRFVRRPDGLVWRENRVTRRVTCADGSAPFETEIAHNLGIVAYDVPEERVQPSESEGRSL